jgi:DNA-binding LacI/PurR family transcriptional regulator
LLLLHEGQAERPDAVVITDDNLVEGFTAGIRDSGVRVAADGTGDLVVVAQANCPYPTHSHVPAKWLGYSITRLMTVCLERIEQQRRDELPPSHTAIPAVWEDDL